MIEATSKSLPVILSPNFSVGVNALFWLTREAARMLGEDFDLEIVETHHRLKKDAPSGTAKKLAEILCEVRKLDYATDARHGREGLIGERPAKEIGVHSIRAGDVVGDHTVTFGGLGERLELTHKASSRETFAAGALRAARWIVGKPPGLYSMEDVLGLDPAERNESRRRARFQSRRAARAICATRGRTSLRFRGALPPMRSSAIYETEPVGCEKGAGKFLNAAIEFGYAGEALDLLHELAAHRKIVGPAGRASEECFADDRPRPALFRRARNRDGGLAIAPSPHYRARICSAAAGGYPAGSGSAEADRVGRRFAAPVSARRLRWCGSDLEW